ncbi:MAG: hypothetical protein FGM46_05405 [Ferruginibacter sp.]|nr:hypothetical protein [Ferruginibacter sp.]
MKKITIIILAFAAFTANSQSIFTKRTTYKQREIVLFSDGSWQYVKQTNIDNVIPQNLIENAVYENKGRNYLFFDYPAPEKPFISLSYSSKTNVYKDPSIFNYENELYKEISSDSFSQVRMKFTGDSVRTIITGTDATTFLLDSNKNHYVVVIYHENGLQSWYYPIKLSNPTVDPKNPGHILGYADDIFYFQLRYRNKSISLQDILKKNSNYTLNKIILEASDFPKSDSKGRYQGFIKSINKKINQQNIKYNFEKELNKDAEQKTN